MAAAWLGYALDNTAQHQRGKARPSTAPAWLAYVLDSTSEARRSVAAQGHSMAVRNAAQQRQSGALCRIAGQ